MKENIKIKRHIVYRGQVYDALEAERIKSLGNIAKPYYDGYADGLKRAIQILANDVEDVPAVDVRPVVRGKWVVSRTDYGWNCVEFPTHCKCTECGREVPYQDKDNFCPNCGADMREVTDEP